MKHKHLLLFVLLVIASYYGCTYLDNYITTGQLQPQEVTIGQCYRTKPDPNDAPWEKPDRTIRLILDRTATKVLYVWTDVDLCISNTNISHIVQRFMEVTDCTSELLQCQKTYPNHVGEDYWHREEK